MPVKFQKKDGQLEDFDRNKVLNGVMKSGATPEQAEEVTKQVETWVQGAAIGGMIKNFEVRNQVLEVLKKVNPTAAAAFEAYQKPAPFPPVSGPTQPPPTPVVPPTGI